jgi:hypothetical protein
MSFNPISSVSHFVKDTVNAASDAVHDTVLGEASNVQHVVEDKALPAAGHFVRDTVAPPLAAARDAVRDRAVSTWNKLPGNELVESAVGKLADHLPFNNAAEAAFRALAGKKEITLDKDATDEIQRDPSFLEAEKRINPLVVAKAKENEKYGKEAFDIPLSELGNNGNVLLELGGQRGEGMSMKQQLLHAWELTNGDIRKTWGVAGNELTWLLRHCQLSGTAHVAKDGSITIEYTVKDHLDLSAQDGRSGAYNDVSKVTGGIWHGVLGAEKPVVTGTFTRTVPA